MLYEILKIIFPTGYDKVYKEYKASIKDEKERKATIDNKTYVIKNLSSEMGIIIDHKGGK